MNQHELHIKLLGLSVTIHRRQFPEAADYWDGNWLVVTAQCDSGYSSVSVSGPILHLSELVGFKEQVERLNVALEGEARIDGIEPNLSVRISAQSRGRMELSVSITPDHLNEQHRFKFELDQSYLLPLIDQCRAILDAYPIKDRKS